MCCSDGGRGPERRRRRARVLRALQTRLDHRRPHVARHRRRYRQGDPGGRAIRRQIRNPTRQPGLLQLITPTIRRFESITQALSAPHLRVKNAERTINAACRAVLMSLRVKPVNSCHCGLIRVTLGGIAQPKRKYCSKRRGSTIAIRSPEGGNPQKNTVKLTVCENKPLEEVKLSCIN